MLYEDLNVGGEKGKGEERRSKSRRKDQEGEDGGDLDQEIEAKVARRCQTWIYFKGRTDKIY